MKTNIIHNTDCLSGLKELPDKMIDMCVTSPPYWALRDYGESVSTVWGGKDYCNHKWGVGDNVKVLERKENGGDWVRPSREAFNKIGSNFECVVCGEKFKGKLGQKFCSTKCLNTLSNDDRTRAVANIDFCQRCGAWRGQLGLEPTFDLYISHLCDIFDEVKRVLKDEGTCWVNLGDTYGGSMSDGNAIKDKTSKQAGYEKTAYPKNSGKKKLTPKCLVMIPFRFAIEMVNRGWILRNTIVWHKPNCMPSSAKDRFTVDFEYMFFFSKRKKYYFETQYEPWKDKNKNDTKRAGFIKYGGKHADATENKGGVVGDPVKGRNKRTVWSICPKPFPEAHFAVYPEELIETPIKAGCPESVCKECGKARTKIYEKGEFIKTGGKRKKDTPSISEKAKREGTGYHKHNFVGWSDCGCNAGFESGVVLDPFMGAGTTALVSLKQGKKFIGFELNKEYIDIAEKRIKPFREQKKLTLRELFE